MVQIRWTSATSANCSLRSYLWIVGNPTAILVQPPPPSAGAGACGRMGSVALGAYLSGDAVLGTWRVPEGTSVR